MNNLFHVIKDPVHGTMQFTSLEDAFSTMATYAHNHFISPDTANNDEYDLLVQRLDELLDIIGENEDNPLMNLVDAISRIISEYDEKHFQISANGIDALKFLMESRNLKQSDLHEIGSQGVVSEILNEKRKLNLRQVKILSKLFNVSPETFI